MKRVIGFLELNGFKNTLENEYSNGKCTVTIVHKGYIVSSKIGSMFSSDSNIYWLIGVLTYHNYIDKKYETFTSNRKD